MAVPAIAMLLLRIGTGALLFLSGVVSVHDKAWVSAALFSTALVAIAYPEFVLEPSWRNRITIAVVSSVIAVWFLPDSYLGAWKG
jgi:uncharacterized membrane protein HdeD (DUF308 family)